MSINKQMENLMSIYGINSIQGMSCLILVKWLANKVKNCYPTRDI